MEQFLKDQIKITLSGNKNLTYKINLYNNDFVKRWFDLFKDIIKKNLIIEKNYCFLGFADSTRNLEFLCKELNLAIDQINKFNNHGQWQKNGLNDYYIADKFVTDDFITSSDLPTGRQLPGCRLKHEACNRLHRYFEDLQGQAWNLSKYFYVADNETKYAIRQLNNLCHEIEGWVNAFRKSKFEPEWIRPSQITTFLHAPRESLKNEDYDLFLQNRYDRELGGVYLHWSQVGKTLYEVWRDHDEAVGEGGINNQQLYSGEFDIEWGKTVTDEQSFKKQEMDEYKAWLKENNYDWNDPKLALGYIKIGQVDLQDAFGSSDFLKVYAKLIECLNISKIEIIGQENLKKEYNYTLSDNNWKNLQIEELKKGYESYSLR